MARRPVSLVLAAVLLTGSAGLAPWTNYLPASDTAPSAIPSGILFHKRVEEVDVTFAVRNRQGRALADLTPDDVTVFADGTAVPSLTSFHVGNNVPLQVTLMLDTSDSMGNGFSGEQAAAMSFLRNIIRPEIDEASVVAFATDPNAGQFRGQPQLLQTAVDHFRAAGQTALYDALYGATQESLISGQGQRARRAIVLLSDGEDNWSRNNLQDVIESAQRSDVAIYAITAHSRKWEYPGDRVLNRLTAETGGCAFILDNFSHADQAFARIAAELRSQYRLSFRAPAARLGYHSLHISLRRQGKWQVRSRTGYFSSLE
ncbi:MAG TPA: VWA domain-containing protein [Terriglobales bacterium]|nr:VWA domain-containing protein [Terriglobales bacterium]